MFFRKYFQILISAFLLLVFNAAFAATKTDSLKALLLTTHNIEKKTELLYQFSNQLLQTNPDTALVVVNEALKLSVNTNKRQQAVLHNLRGKIYTITDKVEKAIGEFKLAEELLLEFDDKSELLISYMSLGNIFIQLDNLPEAMDKYNKAVQLAQQIPDSVMLARLYNNLGILNLYLHNNDKALDLYSKALTLFKKIPDTVNIAGTTTNIGSIYLNLNNFEIAKKYYLQGYELFKSIELTEGEAHALLKLGILEMKREHYDDALSYLNQSLAKQVDNETNYSGIKSIFISETLINRGIVLLKTSRLNDARNDLNKGMELAVDGGDLGLMSLASDYLSQYYSEVKEFKRSLEYHKLFKKYSDSITSESSIKKITQLEMQFQYEESLLEKETQNKLLIHKQQRNKLFSIFFVVVLALVLTLLIVLLRLEKNKKKKIELSKINLEEKLEHANKELTTHVMYLLRKNEFIISISEKLKSIKLDAKTENKQRITELINELERNSKMVSWDEFELRFQQVYISFYKNLNRKFPDLTQNEIRLCAFAKLNMTTKEIAAITFQSTNSISVARYRLRKKLGLSQEENLHHFFADY